MSAIDKYIDRRWPSKNIPATEEELAWKELRDRLTALERQAKEQDGWIKALEKVMEGYEKKEYPVAQAEHDPSEPKSTCGVCKKAVCFYRGKAEDKCSCPTEPQAERGCDTCNMPLGCCTRTCDENYSAWQPKQAQEQLWICPGKNEQCASCPTNHRTPHSRQEACIHTENGCPACIPYAQEQGGDELADMKRSYQTLYDEGQRIAKDRRDLRAKLAAINDVFGNALVFDAAKGDIVEKARIAYRGGCESEKLRAKLAISNADLAMKEHAKDELRKERDKAIAEASDLSLRLTDMKDHVDHYMAENAELKRSLKDAGCNARLDVSGVDGYKSEVKP